MKVLLIDDHPLILAALQTVIRGIGNDTTVTGAETAEAARALLRADPAFDLVLLDLQLADADGFDVLVEFRAAYPALPVVVLSASERPADVVRVIDAGAMGFVHKRASNATLFEALHLVMSGGIYVPPMSIGGDASPSAALRGREGETVPGALRVDTVASASPASPRDAAATRQRPLAELGLTPRQTEVLGLLLKGQANKLIARELGLSVETVKDHVAAVLRALNVASRTQAVLAVSQMSGPGGPLAWR